MGLVISPQGKAVTSSDISLLDLMIDSYELKMISWSEKFAYTEEGPGIDARPRELNMQQSQLHLNEYDGLLEQSINEMSQSLKTFSLNWQKTSAPGHTQAQGVESSQQAFTRFIQEVMSPSSR